MEKYKSYTTGQNKLGAFFLLMQKMKAERDAPFLTVVDRSGDLIPDTLPVFVNPKAKIGRDGRIQNISEFKGWDDVFDFSRCLQCSALQSEHYGSSCESPCMKCHSLVEKIKEKNDPRYHIPSAFQAGPLPH